MVRNSDCPASVIPYPSAKHSNHNTHVALFNNPLYLSKDSADDRHIPTTDFNVLRLDLKLGSQHSSTSGASLVSQLKKSSIANLLDQRITTSVTHIDKLRLRVEDTSSKVLATGDLNAGKSTFVNALLRREVMPAVPLRSARFTTRHKIMEEIVAGNETTQPMIKLYFKLADTRTPSESLLNGVVDISLIDAPGLNRDSIKTTAVFAHLLPISTKTACFDQIKTPHLHHQPLFSINNHTFRQRLPIFDQLAPPTETKATSSGGSVHLRPPRIFIWEF
jgi:50S ribosome-binding GTPase